MPRVSIVMPTYNCAEYIPESIQSILAQDFQDFELIVVDDGSTDTTTEVIKGFEAVLQNRLTYVKTQNRGASEARNTALNLCRGEFIAFLDADDIWLPHKLSSQTGIFEKHPQSALVFSNAALINSKGQMLNKDYIKNHEFKIPAPQIYTQILATRNFIPFSSIIVKKEVLSHIGNFDDKFKSSQDTDWLLRVASQYTLYGLQENLMHYRIHSTAISRNVGLRKHDVIEILLKNMRVGEKIEKQAAKEILKRISENYYEWGYDEFQSHNFASARKKFIQSAQYNLSVYPRKYYYAALTLLPLTLINNLRKIKRVSIIKP